MAKRPCDTFALRRSEDEGTSRPQNVGIYHQVSGNLVATSKFWVPER